MVKVRLRSAGLHENFVDPQTVGITNGCPTGRILNRYIISVVEKFYLQSRLRRRLLVAASALGFILFTAGSPPANLRAHRLASASPRSPPVAGSDWSCRCFRSAGFAVFDTMIGSYRCNAAPRPPLFGYSPAA